jgi:hypothetical protein
MEAVLKRVYKLPAPSDVLVVEYGDMQFSFCGGLLFKKDIHF